MGTTKTTIKGFDSGKEIEFGDEVLRLTFYLEDKAEMECLITGWGLKMAIESGFTKGSQRHYEPADGD